MEQGLASRADENLPVYNPSLIGALPQPTQKQS